MIYHDIIEKPEAVVSPARSSMVFFRSKRIFQEKSGFEDLVLGKNQFLLSRDCFRLTFTQKKGQLKTVFNLGEGF